LGYSPQSRSRHTKATQSVRRRLSSRGD